MKITESKQLFKLQPRATPINNTRGTNNTSQMKPQNEVATNNLRLVNQLQQPLLTIDIGGDNCGISGNVVTRNKHF